MYLSDYITNKNIKINQFFSFNFLSDLNMAPYCSSITDDTDFTQSRYDLYGIINHRGTAWFGHYTSYARLLANNDAAKTEIGNIDHRMKF